MRTFNFNWKLVPRNDAETRAIKNILQVLRGRSLPDYAAKLGLSSNSGSLDSGNISDRWLTVLMCLDYIGRMEIMVKELILFLKLTMRYDRYTN